MVSQLDAFIKDRLLGTYGVAGQTLTRYYWSEPIGELADWLYQIMQTVHSEVWNCNEKCFDQEDVNKFLWGLGGVKYKIVREGTKEKLMANWDKEFSQKGWDHLVGSFSIALRLINDLLDTMSKKEG